MKSGLEKEKVLENQLELRVREVLRKAQALEGPPSAPPYLKTRVLAELRARRDASRKLWFWKACAGAASAFSVILIVVLGVIPRFGGGTYVAFTGQPFLVNVEVKDLRSQGISYASIELPPDVQFYSEKFPEVRKQRKLDLTLSDANGPAQLPFVIHSESQGAKKIELRFYDRNHNVVAQKTIRIRFDRAGNPV